MAKMLIALGLIFLNVGVVFAQSNINTLFTVQSGATEATCDAQVATLNAWITESYNSLTQALTAIGFYNENSVRGNNVRQAMLTYFKIPNSIPKNTANLKSLVENINNNLFNLQQFLDGQYLATIPASRAYFFCDSTWLVEEDPDEQAYDFQGNPVEDADGDIVPINTIPAYIAQLKGGNVPWWSGAFTTPSVYGYTFAPTLNQGGNYCQLNTNTGYYTPILRYNGEPYESTIICPNAFTNAQPASYAAGIGMITTGEDTGTSLERALPKSATLLHEAMHITFGGGFLAGSRETYLLAEVVELARINPGNSRINPENYVYFVAAMNYMFGGQAMGITTNFNFVAKPFNAQACAATGATQCS